MPLAGHLVNLVGVPRATVRRAGGGRQAPSRRLGEAWRSSCSPNPWAATLMGGALPPPPAVRGQRCRSLVVRCWQPSPAEHSWAGGSGGQSRTRVGQRKDPPRREREWHLPHSSISEFYLIRSFPAHFWKFHPLPPESAQAFSTSEICTPEATPGGFFTFWDKVLSQAEQGFQGQVTSEPGRRGDVARS